LNDVLRSGGGPAALLPRPARGLVVDPAGELARPDVAGYGERIISSGARSSKAIKRGRRRCGAAAGHG
jgi:hypothetical protein